MAYVEPKYIKMSDDIIRWYNSLIEKSKTKEELFKNFFTELPSIAGNSITKKAMAINITTRIEPWLLKAIRDDALDQFKRVRKIISSRKPYGIYYADMYETDTVYLIDQKSGYMKCYEYLGSYANDDIRERFKKDGLELDARGNITNLKHRKKVVL